MVVVCKAGSENPQPLKGSLGKVLKDKKIYYTQDFKIPLKGIGAWDENYYLIR